MFDRDSINDVLQRTGLTAMMYYPEIHAEESGYNLSDDSDWCLEPLTALTGAQDDELRVLVGLVITNPTEHRQALFAALLALAPTDG